MSASMAEVLQQHAVIQTYPDKKGGQCFCGKALLWRIPTIHARVNALSAHQAEVLAANGYGKLEEAQARAYDKGYGHGKYDQKFHPAMSLSGTPRPEKSRRNPYRAATERGQHD